MVVRLAYVIYWFCTGFAGLVGTVVAIALLLSLSNKIPFYGMDWPLITVIFISLGLVDLFGWAVRYVLAGR